MKIANVAYGDGLLYPERSREQGLREYLEEQQPDVVTLQKLLTNYPATAEGLRSIGYESAFRPWRDQSDKGVAVLSRLGKPEVVDCHLPGAKGEDSRFLTVMIGGIRVSSIYALYGSYLEPEEAITRRVEWIDRLRDHVCATGYDQQDSVLCGDFNVKLDGPPWKGKYYSVCEREALVKLMQACGYCDLYRKVYPCAEQDPGFTYGGSSRLHLMLGSESLARRLVDVRLDCGASAPRKDAPPLVVELGPR